MSLTDAVDQLGIPAPESARPTTVTPIVSLVSLLVLGQEIENFRAQIAAYRQFTALRVGAGSGQAFCLFIFHR